MAFSGTATYVATRELSMAVNAAVQLQKPLLIKGEPGTGKTLLAYEIAQSLGKPLYTWHVKSTTSAQQGLYEYDAVSRLRDSQFGDGSDRVGDLAHYIRKGKLWQAFESEEQAVLLIDEIDKADIEFPNDLLLELDRMEFYCYELQQTIKARHRPIVIITSNNEKELPDAFLRRCFFHFIRFPNRETMEQIVGVHYPDLPQELMTKAMSVFYSIRDVRALKKKPSTSELIDWIRLLLVAGVTHDDLNDLDALNELPPYLGALLKNEQDTDLMTALRRKGGRPY
ncbi:MoxR-like ATPase [Spirosoma lacussanchae]|uniref:AAA family ATPase n=1 Tax=Spirosoma lacussanchae TaxID=1884249 RepID=UPI001107C16C|nr:MoxR family ATPase [Spirosoma lacussanchae]